MSQSNIARRTIGLREAVLLIAGIVSDFGPGHVGIQPGSGSCTYTDEKESDADTLTPVCIVGHLFSRLGILRAVFTPSGQEGACDLGGTMWANAEVMGVTFTEQARTFLRTVQGRQDSPVPWGEALTQALSITRENLNEQAEQAARDAREAFLSESGVHPDDYYLNRRVSAATAEPSDEDPFA